MRKTFRTLALLTLTAPVVSAAGAPAAPAPAAPAPSPARVFEPGKAPADPRQFQYNVDNPYPFKADFPDKAAWERRAKDLREQVLVASGLWPMPPLGPLNPTIHGKIDRGDYTIEKVFFASRPGHYVTGNLYRPKGKPGKLPAVLNPHGHWANGRFFEASEAEAKKHVETGAEKTMESARYPLQARMAQLARMGCVVFHYDMLGYADNGPIVHRLGFNDVEADLRLQNMMGLQTWNSIRALDFVTGLPDVDPARVAVTGASGGGTQTFVLCAVDGRPAVSMPMVMVSTAMQGGCVCENGSYLRVNTNNIELAGLFAPKPQGMSGANDWTKEIETKGLPDLKAIYGYFGAADKVMAKYFSFPHNYNQVSRELMYNWVNPHLNLGQPSPVAEKPFTPVPPKELSVYDDQHPKPADSLDAAALRVKMTEESEVQMAAIAKDPAKHREVVGAALRVMMNDRLPEASALAINKAGEPATSGGVKVERGTVGRAKTGEVVPFAWLVPEGWNGTTVVWAHPGGKASLFAADGQTVDPAVRKLLDAKAAVLAGDVFRTGEMTPTAGLAPLKDVYYHQVYGGFVFGYNTSTLANRVHDLLSLVAMAKAREGSKAVHLIGTGKAVGVGRAGPWALLAKALAGEAVGRVAVDLENFDWDLVRSNDDPMMQPGAVKYGGIYGFVPLCAPGQVFITSARKTGSYDLAAATPGVTLQQQDETPEKLAEWLVKVQ